MGLTPRAVDQKRLRHEIDRLRLLFEALPDVGTFGRAGISQLAQTTIPKSELKTRFDQVRDILIPSLAHRLGLPPVPFRLEYSTVENNWWGAWADTADDGTFRLTLNLAPQTPWRPGDPERIATHEGVHILHMAAWRDAIAGGRAPRIAGLTTTFGPEAVVTEGLADTIPLLLPDLELPPITRFWWQAAGLRYLASNRAIVKAFEDKDPRGATDELLRDVPLDYQRPAIERTLGGMLKIPHAAYVAAYAMGWEYLSAAIGPSAPTAEAVRNIVARTVTSIPIPRDISELASPSPSVQLGISLTPTNRPRAKQARSPWRR